MLDSELYERRAMALFWRVDAIDELFLFGFVEVLAPEIPLAGHIAIATHFAREAGTRHRRVLLLDVRRHVLRHVEAARSIFFSLLSSYVLACFGFCLLFDGVEGCERCSVMSSLICSLL